MDPEGLEKLLAWARMSFKQAKSKSLVLKKGRVVDKFHISVSGTATISTISGLERIVNCYLRRWLGLPRSLSSITLYGNTYKTDAPEIYQGGV